MKEAYIAANILRFAPRALSDAECKTIRETTNLKELAQEILARGAPFSLQELMFIVEGVGDPIPDKDDVLEAYADHIRNYRYNYNDEAKKVDPGIDTSVEHIGPMAQDIEQVNPAAVNADPKTGYKTVDVGRLALMNAGAIAELARRLREVSGESNTSVR